MRRRRRPSLLPWTSAANGIALLALIGGGLGLSKTGPDAFPPVPTSGELPSVPGYLIAAAPSPPIPPPRTIIRQRRVHHLPGPVEPGLPPPPVNWPWLTPLPSAKPGATDQDVAKDPLGDSLQSALLSSGGTVSDGRRHIQLRVVSNGAADESDGAARVLVGAVAGGPPEAAWLELGAADRLWRDPHDVQQWRSAGDGPKAWWHPTRGVLYLDSAALAGWLARRAEAQDLLRNLLADNRVSAPVS